jgi:uncharacterized protein
MRCVKCAGQLVTVRIEDVDVDQCPQCGGIWFDAHELERVLGQARVDPLLGRAPPEPSHDERRGRCPRCRGEGYLVQIRSRAAPIHVDTCAICGGKWLDGGELDLLRRRSVGRTLRRLLNWLLNLDL